MAKKELIIIGIIIALTLLLIALVIAKWPEPEEETPVAELPEAPDATVPLASGKQAYEIRTTGRTFKITEVELDPIDVQLNEEQLVKVFVEDTEDRPITNQNKVEGTAFTDNKATPFSFELKEVSDTTGGATLTKWEGSWVLEDTYDRIYVVSIIAKRADEEHKVEITLR